MRTITIEESARTLYLLTGTSDAKSWRNKGLDTAFETPTDKYVPQYDATSGTWLLVAPDSLITGGFVNAAGDTMTGDLQMAADIKPTTHDARSLGTTLLRWAAIFVTAITASTASLSGAVTAASFAGDGSLLTALNATQLTTGTVPDGRIASTSVTQHQASLAIAETQITDGSLLARLAGTETVTGLWTFSHASGLLSDVIGERTATAGVTIDGLLIKDSGIPQAAVTAHQAALSIGAAQVTAGTFGAGAFAFNGAVSGITTLTATTLAGALSTAAQTSVTSLGTLTGLDIAGALHFTTNPTVNAGGLGRSATNGLTMRGVTGSTYDLALIGNAGTVALGIRTGTAGVSLPNGTLEATDLTLSGRLYVQGSAAPSIIDKALQVGNANHSGTRLSVGVSQNTTATSGAARKGLFSGNLVAAANNDVLYGMEIAPTVSVGGYTGTTFYGLKIGDVAGAATNWALYTGTGAVRFGGSLTASAGGSLTGTWTDLGSVTTVDINGGTIDGAAIGGAVAAAGAFTTLGTTGVVNVANGAPAGSLRIGADVAASTYTALTRKIGRVTAPNYTNAGEAPNIIVLGADANGTDNIIQFGGAAGTSQYLATRLEFFVVSGITTTGAGESAKVTITSSGATTARLAVIGSVTASEEFVVTATKKIQLDGSAGVGGDTYIAESSANVLDLYAGGANGLRLTYVSPGIASATFVGTAILPAATTSLSPLRIPHGTAHSTPTNGDIWTTTGGVYQRINGATLISVLAASATKVTAAAPYTNDGYVEVNIGGTTLRLMTTA